MKLLDVKICQLPEIIIFRDFLLRQTSEDEVFYYLMCRNILHRGAQLLNFINVGDPFVYLNYESTRYVLSVILEKHE